MLINREPSLTNTFIYEPFCCFYRFPVFKYSQKKPQTCPHCWSVLLQLVLYVHTQHQVHAMRALTCYLWKSLHFKHENKLTRLNNFFFFMTEALQLPTFAEFISDYRGKCSAGNGQFDTKRKHDSWRSEEPTLVGCSLALFWDSHCASSTEV